MSKRVTSTDRLELVETMTPAELRSIDAQVAERVMGYEAKVGPNMGNKVRCWRILPMSSVPFEPTESDADAFAVLRRCNEHINEFKYREVIGISTIAGDPLITYRPKAIAECAKTLPLAISLFALKLWE